jgi:hypothetical protein
VLLPAPAGPSMATIGRLRGMRAGFTTTRSAHPHAEERRTARERQGRQDARER